MIPIESLSRIEKGRCLILGNGPSLNQFDDLDIPKGVKVISLNRSWRKQVGDYHCIIMDSHYLEEIKKGDWKPNKVIYVGSRGSIQEGVKTKNFALTKLLRGKLRNGYKPWDIDQGYVVQNTGHLAICTAIYLGFKQIYLLGFDSYGFHFKFEGKDDDDLNHYLHRVQFKDLRWEIENAKLDVKIVNLNQNTKVEAWPIGEF